MPDTPVGNTSPKFTELTFQLIVESSPNAIVLVNKEGKIAYVNNQTEKLFGYGKGELIGNRVEQLIPDRFTKTILVSWKCFSRPLL